MVSFKASSLFTFDKRFSLQDCLPQKNTNFILTYLSFCPKIKHPPPSWGSYEENLPINGTKMKNVHFLVVFLVYN
jgi:hypothetical protein